MSLRHLFPVIVFPLVVAAGDFDKSKSGSGADVTTTTVRPLSITYEMREDGRLLRVVGHFTYAHVKPDEPGIISDGYGGACLVVKQGNVCRNDSECPQPVGGHGYCLDKLKAGHLEVGGGVCWVKPDETYCFKAPIDNNGKTLELGKPYEARHVLQAPATVRLVTCLNPPHSTWPADGPPCASLKPGALHGAGPPVTIP